MSGRYHDQFEPAWPGRWVGTYSDIGEFSHELTSREPNLTISSVSNLTRCATVYAIKTVDAAIAHAIRESHRN